nr:hypothetical protein [uncultured Rhodococcus sp.]
MRAGCRCGACCPPWPAAHGGRALMNRVGHAFFKKRMREEDAVFGGEVTVPTALVALRMIRMEGSFVGTLDQLRDLVGIARAGQIPTIPIAERDLSAHEVTRALDELTAGGVAGRIVLTAPH